MFAEETASRILLELHDLGIRLAIDDFGSGWSSMARLVSFPWGLLKIDRSFVQARGKQNQHAEQVVSSTIALAHALGIPTTAEGVETSEQLDRLAELGCDIAQGYLFARPSPAPEAITHVTAHARWTGPGTRLHMASSAPRQVPVTSRGVTWRTAWSSSLRRRPAIEAGRDLRPCGGCERSKMTR